MNGIYLDYNASTPIAPEVRAAMLPWLETAWGNPSSGRFASIRAGEALERARTQVAELLGAASDEIVFTSDGSEANNLTLKGSYFALCERGRHMGGRARCGPAERRWPQALCAQG